jgi:hypothetical protein
MGGMIAACNNLHHLSNNTRHLRLESGKSGWHRRE